MLMISPNAIELDNFQRYALSDPVASSECVWTRCVTLVFRVVTKQTDIIHLPMSTYQIPLFHFGNSPSLFGLRSCKLASGAAIRMLKNKIQTFGKQIRNYSGPTPDREY